jgi:hypothetical protein
MTAAVERGMRSASVEFALDVIGQLSSEGVLKCSLEDAIKMFDFESVAVVSSRSKASKKRESGKSKSVKKASKPKITAKPTLILPFCGEIQGDWCKGVKFNHGLHTQCTNGPSGEDTYCKTCRKHADNSATGKPPYGDINDRAEFNVDYRDPKGKLTLPFANVVEKLSINLETANVAAATLGWTIPAEQLVKRSSKRGRPAKSAAVSDSDSDTEETPKKKRGRPSKAKVAAPTQEDQIAQLVAEAYAETKTTKPVIKKVKVKKLKLTAEQKEQAKIAKKEAADKIKAEKKEAADKLKAEKKEAADKLKAEKKEAADKLKAEKKEAADKIKAEKKEAADKLKAEKAAAILAKKEAALKVKEEKLVAKVLEKEAKDAAAAKLKAEKKAIALKARQEKAAAKKAERDAAKLRKKEAADKLKDEKAEENVVVEELEEEVILEDSEIAELEVDSSDDEEEGETELSETMTVGGVEYFFSEMDGQTILFSKTGEPVGLYDAETDTVQECEFDEE